MAAPRSPMADVLDRLVWGRLSTFWSRDYNPDDKEKLNAIYEGCTKALDAEYTRLFEINQSKSIASINPITQRRWLRLDLNRHAELAAFLKFLSTSSAGTTSNNTSGDILSCNTDEHNHAQHWHISFPFTVPQGDPVSRSVIELAYPIDIRLVQVYQMRRNPRTGITRGAKLRPGTDYQLSASRTGIRLNATVPLDQYEFVVGFDLSSSLYDGLRPIVSYCAGYNLAAANVVRIDSGLSVANLPIHALIVKNVRDTGSDGLPETNTPTFSSKFVFIPWTGTNTGPLHGAEAGTVALPSTVNLEATDAVFIFGLVRGDFTETHRHIVATTLLNPGAAPRLTSTMVRQAGSTNTVEFDTPILPGVFDSVGYLGQIFLVYLDGLLLPRTEYSFTSDGVLLLKNPITWTADQYHSVAVRTTDEYDVLHGGNADQHVHFECLLQTATPPEFYETFDDGGDFDDEQGGTFDDKRTLNVVYLDDVGADLGTLEVWVDGARVLSDVDYVATYDNDSKRVRLSFGFNIKNHSIYVSYRRESRTFVYGRFATGFVTDTLSGLLTDLQALNDSFSSTSGIQISNIGKLVEAAQTAVAGGNPLLTLFYDERPEYASIQTDSNNVAVSLDDARLLESMGTQLIAIPFLCDRVLRPTIRLEQGVDYDVVNGEIRSSFDLTSQRYASDAQPGVWWCPIVLLDEQMLRKNFGSLVGDERSTSTESYRTALHANMSLRFSGPVVQDLERAAAILYGSPIFTQDGRVTAVGAVTVAYDIVVAKGKVTQTVRIPASSGRPNVGENVLRTQSLAGGALFNGPLTGLVVHKLSTVVAELPYTGAQTGDIVHLTTFDPADPTNTPINFISKLLSAVYDANYPTPRTTLSMQDAPRFDVTPNSHMRLLRDMGPPYAANDGVVTAVDPINETQITTTTGSYTLPPGRMPEQRVGDFVVRNQPIFQSYASLYDDIRRPNWHWLRPEHYSKDWAFALNGTGTPVTTKPVADRRYAVVSPPQTVGDYSTIALDPITPIVKRGIQIQVVDDRTLATLTFTVVGLNGSEIFVTPQVTNAINGAATIVDNTAIAADYFGMATPPTSAPVESKLSFAQPIRARVLQVLDTSRFPAAGQCVVRLPNGGSTEVSYKRVARGFLLDCEWPSVFPALTDQNGVLHSQLPAAAVVRLVSEHRQTRLNPAFISLVNLRVTQDLRTSDKKIQVNDQNADALYAFFKNTSAVIESAAITRPQVLRDLMDDVIPPGSTVVTMSRHRIIDVYSGGAGES